MSDSTSAADDISAAIEAARSAIESAEMVSESTELVRTSGSGVDIVQSRRDEAVAQRAAVMHARNAAEVAQKKAKELIEQEKNRLQRMLWDLEAEMAPMREKLERMGDGINALNIYLGRNEEITVIREGERAPEDEVVYVRQGVLAMDEESIISAAAGGMDFRDIDKFIEWLDADDAHIEQIIPERKAIVAMIPRRAHKRYSDPWMQDEADRENRHTHWIIRNGECLWITTTDFTVGSRTVPASNEFTKLFLTRDHSTGGMKKMEPGTREWERAEKESDQRTRHYMKVALLLEGLMHRTTVLHPISPNLSFLDQSSYDDGRISVILDGENALTSGRPSFTEWQKEKRSHLRAGMRVVGAFGSHMRTYRSREYGRADVRPEGATPDNNVVYILRDGTRAAGTRFMFSFERGTVWDRDTFEQRSAKMKATGYLNGDEDWIVPVDLVTEEEIEHYLNSRTERTHYLKMVPTLHAVLAVKRAEREQEAPFRAALLGVLSKEIDMDAAESMVDDLITWFKTANKWQRSLDAEDATSIRTILAEARRRMKGDVDPTVLDRLRAQHPDAVAIAKRTSDLVVVTVPKRAYPSEPETLFVDLHVHGLRGGHKSTETWTMLRRASVSRWTIVHSTDTWSTMTFDERRDAHLSDAQIAEMIEHILAHHQRVAQIRLDGVKVDVRKVTDDGKVTALYGDVAVRGDVVSVPLRNYFHSETDDLSHTYWGQISASRAVYEDADLRSVVDDARAKAERETEEQHRITRRVMTAARSIEKAWEEQENQRQFAIFMEDFGDASLWEGHQKTVKMPQYPGESTYSERQRGSWHFNADSVPMLSAIRKSITEGRPLDGLTVREVVEREGFSVDKVHEQIVDLRFPAKEEEK